jgi:4-amino-4-deoxychorismate lyase
MAAPVTHWWNGVEGESPPLDSRTLRYGDGLFETIPLWRGKALYAPEHEKRWNMGIRQLKLAPTDFVAALKPALADAPDRAVVRMSLHPLGGSGYARDPHDRYGIFLERRAWVDPWAEIDALKLRVCKLRLSEQPALAGIKHANRLEAILARTEWNDPSVHDGVLLDRRGHVIETTAANLLVLSSGRWRTPMLDVCGVAGVLRTRLVRKGYVHEANFDFNMLENADAVALCSSLRGLKPVAQIGSKHWRDPLTPLKALDTLMQRWDGYAFYASAPISDGD